jgi:hypothetical protein
MSLIARLSPLAFVASSLVLVAPACSGKNGGSGFGDGGSGFGNSSSGGSGSGSPGDDGGTGSSSGSVGSFGDGGYAGDSSISADAGCATGHFQGTKQPVYMLFILDGSGSMSQDNKWTAVVPALESIFTDMNAKADPGIAAGLIVFSDSQDQSCSPFGGCNGPYPQPKDVPIAFVGSAQLNSLKNRLSGMPNDGTPTYSAMSGGYGELESYMPSGSNPPPGGQKVMVLITDGVPTDMCAQNGGSYSSNTCVTMAGSKLTEAMPKGPIKTFVIGVGQYPSSDLTNFDPSFLGNVAQSGGTGPMGCNPNENTAGATDLCYFEVDPTVATSPSQLQQSFENAINAIRGQVASCTISLSGNSNVDPTKVNVTINGMTIPQDPANGWTYNNPTNPTSITLHGTACMDLQGNPMASVQIILGCKTITPM